jgi:hypothetical protein
MSHCVFDLLENICTYTKFRFMHFSYSFLIFIHSSSNSIIFQFIHSSIYLHTLSFIDWIIHGNIHPDIFYTVLTMVHNTQNCWTFGLCPSFSILELGNTAFRKLDLFPSSCEWGGTYVVGCPKKSYPQSLYNPCQIHYSSDCPVIEVSSSPTLLTPHPVTRGRKKIQFQKICVIQFLEYRTMNKVQKPNNSEYPSIRSHTHTHTHTHKHTYA